MALLVCPTNSVITCAAQSSLGWPVTVPPLSRAECQTLASSVHYECRASVPYAPTDLRTCDLNQRNAAPQDGGSFYTAIGASAWHRSVSTPTSVSLYAFGRAPSRRMAGQAVRYDAACAFWQRAASRPFRAERRTVPTQNSVTRLSDAAPTRAHGLGTRMSYWTGHLRSVRCRSYQRSVYGSSVSTLDEALRNCRMHRSETKHGVRLRWLVGPL